MLENSTTEFTTNLGPFMVVYDYRLLSSYKTVYNRAFLSTGKHINESALFFSPRQTQPIMHETKQFWIVSITTK